MIMSAMCGESSSALIQVGELWLPEQPGVHDHNTILLDTRSPSGNRLLSRLEAGMVFVHEYSHARRARDAGVSHDPWTRDPVCGKCNHAVLHLNHVALLANYCITAGFNSATNHEDACKSSAANMSAAQEHLAECSSSCSSMGDVHSFLDYAAGQMTSCCGD